MSKLNLKNTLFSKNVDEATTPKIDPFTVFFMTSMHTIWCVSDPPGEESLWVNNTYYGLSPTEQ